MNWYIVVSIVSSFLLGWGIGIWYGTVKGYEAAIQAQQELINQQMWSQYLNSFNTQEVNDEEE